MPIANSLCLRCKQESGRCQGFRRDGVRRVLSRPLNAYHFSNVLPLAGFRAEAAKDGQQVKIWTKLAIASDEPLFHRLVGHFDNVIRHMAQKESVSVNLHRAATVLLVLKPDATAE